MINSFLSFRCLQTVRQSRVLVHVSDAGVIGIHTRVKFIGILKARDKRKDGLKIQMISNYSVFRET